MINILRALVFSVIFTIVPIVQSDTFKFSTENTDNFPWTMENKTGVNYYLINKALSNLGHSAEITTVSWKRCLNDLATNASDGCFSGSYKDERAKMGHYPMKDGTHDASKRLHSGSYSLYILKLDTAVLAA